VLITNPGTYAVSLDEMQIEIPVGSTGAAWLSASPALPTPVAGLLAGWQASVSGSTVTLKPTGGTPGTVTDALSFTLPGIQVNETQGTVQLTITEFPPSASKRIDDTTYTLVKQDPNVPVTNFWASPTVITEPDQAAVLHWTCSGEGSGYVYSLSSDQGWSPVNCLGGGSCYTCTDGHNGITPPLVQQTTTFTLSIIQAVDGHREVVSTLQTTVAVTVPYFSADYYLAQSGVGTGRFARMHWLAFNADHCQVLMDGKTIDADAPTDVVVDGYSVLVPPDGDPHQFSVVAIPSQGSARATQPYLEATAALAAPSVAVGGGDETTAGAVAVTPDNQLALVCNAATDAITVLSVSTGQLESGLVSPGRQPTGIAITPDSRFALVAVQGDQALAVLDIAGRTVAQTIALAAAPSMVAISPDGSLALVSCQSTNQVIAVDLATWTVKGSPIATGKGPLGLAFTPDGALALVACMSAAAVTVIDVATLTAEPQPIRVGQVPVSVAVTPDGTLALVADYMGSAVSVIDVASRTAEAQTIAVGQYPSAVAVTPDGLYALASSQDRTVSLIEIATRSTLSPAVQAGSGGGGVAITPDGLLAFSTNWNDGTVSLI
jgi:YVTN family beta-propeller protein